MSTGLTYRAFITFLPSLANETVSRAFHNTTRLLALPLSLGMAVPFEPSTFSDEADRSSPWGLPNDDFFLSLDLFNDQQDANEDLDLLFADEELLAEQQGNAAISNCELESESNASSSDPDSASKAAALALKRKRQRQYSHTYYRRRISPYQPVYKNDIRRQYGAMFVNTINYCDFRMTKRFFMKFCGQQCQYLHVFHVPPIVQQLFPTAVKVSLLDQLVLHNAYAFATIPNLTCKLAECKITQAAYGQGSTVSITVDFSGTRMYELGAAIEGKFPRLSSVIANGQSLETANTSATIPSLPYLDEATINRMRVPTDFVQLDCRCIFVFKLDMNHALTALEQHWCSMKMTLPCGVAPPLPPCAETVVPDIFPLVLNPELPSELCGLDDNDLDEGDR